VSKTTRRMRLLIGAQETGTRNVKRLASEFGLCKQRVYELERKVDRKIAKRLLWASHPSAKG
jgi:hypothetical protein